MKKTILFLLVLSLFALSLHAFEFNGYVFDTDGSTFLGGVNITLEDPFNTIGGEPWSNITTSAGYFILHGINDTSTAIYSITMFNYTLLNTSHSNMKIGPIVPPMSPNAFTGMTGPGGMNMSLSGLNWTLRDGALVNITAGNTTQSSGLSFGGEIKDKRLDWPMKGWYNQPDYITNGLIYIPKGRNYTITIWSTQSPPRGYLIPAANLSNGIYHLNVNTTTSLVNVSGWLINSTNVTFTRIRAYWLIGGDSVHLDAQSSLDGAWAVRSLNANTGSYYHEVPTGVDLLLCGYANRTHENIYYEGCTNLTVGTTNKTELNITLSPLVGYRDVAAEPNISKMTINFFKRVNNGSHDVSQAITGRSYIKVKATYNNYLVWWGIETNTTGTIRIPIQNNTNLSVKLFLNDAPPRELDYTYVTQNEINITMDSMDQMVDDQGNELDTLAPSFYRSNNSCDLPTLSNDCQLFNFTNTSQFNPFKMLTLGGNISVRLILPSGVILHYKNVDILAGNPDVHKPKQNANTNTNTTGSIAEAWAFGSMVPKEMYESVLVGVPYNISLVSEDHSFKLLITELYTIAANGTWLLSWNSSGNRNGVNVPSAYQDFAEYSNGLFNATRGGITCSSTNISANCYVDLASNYIWFKIDHFSGVGPQIETYAIIGNITSNQTVYSCWQDSTSTQGCSIEINLTVASASPFVNQHLNITINNTAEISLNNYLIEWWNGAAWINQTTNNTVLNGSNTYNLTAGAHRFRINITLPYATSTKWNITFNINNTAYTLDPYLDSINLTHPVNFNRTEDQTPDFNFTLYSNNWTGQSCTLYLNSSTYGTNNPTTNGTSTKITANNSLTEGNYSWHIKCNVSGQSALRWIYINDTTAPAVAADYSSITTTSATLTVTTNEAATCRYSTDLNRVYSSMDLFGTTGGTSHSTSLTSLSDSTTYNYHIRCRDTSPNANTASAVTVTFTTSTISSAGSAGAGGGASSGVTGTFEKKVWTSINSGETAAVTIQNGVIGITEVEFKIKETAWGSWLNVEKKDSLPSTVTSFPQKAYKYVSITTNNLNEEKLESPTIKFKVAKSWLTENKVGKDNLALFRYKEDKWNELKTTVGEDDGTYVHYTSETPGFSYFAIGEKAKAAPPIVEEIAEAPVAEAPAEAPAEAGEAPVAEAPAELPAKKKNWLWAIPLLAVIAVIIWLVWFRKKK